MKENGSILRGSDLVAHFKLCTTACLASVAMAEMGGVGRKMEDLGKGRRR
jgi:hypothetical protein